MPSVPTHEKRDATLHTVAACQANSPGACPPARLPACPPASLINNSDDATFKLKHTGHIKKQT
jgi:hypothetical protein